MPRVPGTAGGLNVHADIQPAILDGDPLLVQQLAANLIDNAVRHNIPGGDVQVATGTSRAGAVLLVTSPGQVIPAAEVDRLFQPFQRLSPPRRRSRPWPVHCPRHRHRARRHHHGATPPGGGLAIDVTFPQPRYSPEGRARSCTTAGYAPPQTFRIMTAQPLRTAARRAFSAKLPITRCDAVSRHGLMPTAGAMRRDRLCAQARPARQA
jgi:hypothetical protein